jgi:hypothetical protein
MQEIAVELLFRPSVPFLLYTSHQEDSTDHKCDDTNCCKSSAYSTFVAPETAEDILVIALYYTGDISHPELMAPADAAEKDGGGTS